MEVWLLELVYIVSLGLFICLAMKSFILSLVHSFAKYLLYIYHMPPLENARLNTMESTCRSNWRDRLVLSTIIVMPCSLSRAPGC